MKPRKNVLLALTWHDHRLVKGVAAYAAEHGWHLSSSSLTHEQVIPWGWKGDGVLAWLAAGDEIAEFVLSVRKPTVDFSYRRSHLPFARVLQDHAQSARLVAEHFLTRGFREFRFYSDTDNWSQVERGEGFVAALREAGRECGWLKWNETKAHRKHPEEWSRRRAWLATQLRRATKPLAVFAANGGLAVEVLEICEECKFAVPQQIAIVGIDDYLLSTESLHRSVSAVDTNLEEQGYQGAALLDRLMRGEKRPRTPQRIPPARIVTRKSSDITAVAHDGVARALQFIGAQFAAEISVDDVARTAGMSRRGLHQAFLDHLDRTPGEAIRAFRIEAAKKLLAESELKVDAVAHQCGYPNVNSFFVAFKKTAGQPPAEYRKFARRAR